MKYIAMFLIRLYQKTLSFDHSWLKRFKPNGQCKFYPTCSEYAYQAVWRYGILKGMLLGFKRLSRCHPWSNGGVDYAPSEKRNKPKAKYMPPRKGEG